MLSFHCFFFSFSLVSLWRHFLFILFSVLFLSSLFSDILSFLLLQISSSLPFIFFFIISYLLLYIPELIHMMNRLVPIHNAILKETKMCSIKREITIESFLVFSPHSSPLCAIKFFSQKLTHHSAAGIMKDKANSTLRMVKKKCKKLIHLFILFL